MGELTGEFEKCCNYTVMTQQLLHYNYISSYTMNTGFYARESHPHPCNICKFSAWDTSCLFSRLPTLTGKHVFSVLF